MAEFAIFGVALLVTIGGVAAFKRLSSKIGLLDVPNERSSHVTPTPRGGGVVIVAIVLFLYAVAAKVGGSDIEWSYIVGALMVAAVSWLDDLLGLPVIVRLVVHSFAAAILIWVCGPIATVYIPGIGSAIELGWFGQLLSFLWILWLINAYNFMDGIDGIAGVQAVVAGLAWAALGYVVDDRTLYLFGGVIAFSSLGFLFHNWAPASVFLGDVGSAFLGFTFAALPLLPGLKQNTALSSWLFAASIAFVWLFVFDAILTFTRRALRREKVWAAHRQHLYQRLVIGGSGHGTVSLLYGVTGSVVAAAYLAAFLRRGIWEVIFLFSLVVGTTLVTAIAHRKNI